MAQLQVVVVQTRALGAEQDRDLARLRRCGDLERGFARFGDAPRQVPAARSRAHHEAAVRDGRAHVGHDARTVEHVVGPRRERRRLG